jgi:hypothetical protein
MYATETTVDLSATAEIETQEVQLNTTAKAKIETLEQPNYAHDAAAQTLSMGVLIGTVSGGAIAVIVNTILDTILRECNVPHLPIIKLATRIGCKKIWGNALNEKLVAKAMETCTQNSYHRPFNEAMLKAVSRTVAWVWTTSPATLA